MGEKIDELYRKYLNEKLDAIFNGEKGITYKNLFSGRDRNNPKLAKLFQKHGELLLSSYKGFNVNGIFYEGFAIVLKSKKDKKPLFNFINAEGRLLLDEWVDDAHLFKNGLARIKRNGKYNFINTKGQFLLDKWVDWASWYVDDEGFAKIQLNGKFNFINAEGRLLLGEWVDGKRDFHNGYAQVKINGKWKRIDKKGKLLSDEEVNMFSQDDVFKDADETNEEFKIVSKKNDEVAVIDRSERIIIPFGKYKDIQIINNFFIVDGRIIPCKKEMRDYQVNRILMGYECKNSHDKYRLKYQPVKRFGFRYTICINKENLFLYDRISNEYRTIGDIYDIEFDDNFIFDKKNKIK